ncbi:hypothetical protein CQ054_19675 [Ochrobactrum sp. MYb29]|nr:hypothetical protein CWE02_06495 [Brucella pituitosa]PRA82532.1 hypothetical protein CQ054_19675 [Ochrobactrum sp. MYb29]TCQ71948.1 hypothetical protein EDF68_12319 [Ochrobactrum sp. BH3]
MFLTGNQAARNGGAQWFISFQGKTRAALLIREKPESSLGIWAADTDYAPSFQPFVYRFMKISVRLLKRQSYLKLLQENIDTSSPRNQVQTELTP